MHALAGRPVPVQDEEHFVFLSVIGKAVKATCVDDLTNDIK